MKNYKVTALLFGNVYTFKTSSDESIASIAEWTLKRLLVRRCDEMVIQCGNEARTLHKVELVDGIVKVDGNDLRDD